MKEREDLLVVTPEDGERRGWYCHEYTGVSIVNLWSALPREVVGRVRRWNKVTQWFGATRHPSSVNNSIVFKWSWSFPPFLSLFRRSKPVKIKH